MSMFRAYLKVLMKNSTAIIVYISIFVFIAVLNVGSISNDKKSNLKQINEISLGIINEDKSLESKKLENYLKDNFNVKKVIDNPEKIRESIVSEYVYYILKIKKNGDMEYYCNSNREVEMAVAEKLSSYIRINGLMRQYNIKDTEKKINKILKSRVKVNYYLDSSNYKDKIINHIYSYYNFSLYVLLFIFLYAAYQTQSKFKEREIINRISVSSKRIKNFKKELYKYYLSFVFIMWLFFILLSVILYGYKNLISIVGLEFILANFFYILTISSLSCLLSDFIKTDNQASIFINSGCLIVAFISGVFIPIKYLPTYLERFSSFFPMYWSNKVNLAIMNNNFFSQETVTAFIVEILMTIAFTMIYLVLNREKTT